MYTPDRPIDSYNHSFDGYKSDASHNATSPREPTRNESFIANLSGKYATNNRKVYVSTIKRNESGRMDETIFGAKQAQLVADMEDDDKTHKSAFVRWFYHVEMYTSFVIRVLSKQTWHTIFRHTVGILWAIVVAFYSESTGISKLNGDYVALLGSMLGFLVAFRTNQGYQRYLEGRRQWGIFTFNAVALISQGIVGIDGTGEKAMPKGKEIREQLKKYGIAAAYGLKALLRDEAVNPDELENILTPAEVEEINSSFMWPSSYCITKVRKAMWATNRDLNKIMEKSVMHMEEASASCYVIHNNQFPLAYAFLLQATVYIYMWGVPLYFQDQGLGWFLLPPSIVLNQLYAGLIDISVMLDDPFGCDLTDLNLDLFCHVIKQQVSQAVAVQEFEERKELERTESVTPDIDNGTRNDNDNGTGGIALRSGDKGPGSARLPLPRSALMSAGTASTTSESTSNIRHSSDPEASRMKVMSME